MKHFFTFFILAVITLTAYSQTRQQFDQKVDSMLAINRQNNYHLDTLWVLDSSLLYGIPGGSHELMLERKYEVLHRNELGNVLVSLNKVPEFMEPFFLNTELDSIIYFDGVNIKQHYSNAWNSVEQFWVDNKYVEYEAPGLLQEEFDKKFSNGIQQYYYGFREMYDNSNGRVDTMLRYNYNSEMNSWDTFRKTIFYYDESGSCTEEITKQFDQETNSWNNYYMYSYSYNNNGDPDTVELKAWDTENNSWRDNYISYFSYDASGRLTNRVQMKYSISLQEMINDNKFIVDYSNNNIIQISQNWRINNEQWENQFKTFFSYFTENKLDTIQQELWDSSSEQWIKQYLTVSRFDNHENIFEEVYYRFSGADWTLESKTDYYWSPFIPNATHEIQANTLAVYPNPATTQVSFVVPYNQANTGQQALLTIFDLSGRQMTQLPLQNGKAVWDCAGVKAGLYVYSLSGSGAWVSGKVVVR